MRVAFHVAIAGFGLAIGAGLGLAGPARAGLPIVVSADEEAEAANPGHARHRTPAQIKADNDFRATMDRMFGPGRWRQTSGYRTRAQEDALRRRGAGTVRIGGLSRHSVGTPETPGAYDAVVSGMNAQAAAARLRQSGAGFARVLAEAAHGDQGPHLLVELADLPAARARYEPQHGESRFMVK